MDIQQLKNARDEQTTFKAAKVVEGAQYKVGASFVIKDFVVHQSPMVHRAPIVTGVQLAWANGKLKRADVFLSFDDFLSCFELAQNVAIGVKDLTFVQEFAQLTATVNAPGKRMTIAKDNPRLSCATHPFALTVRDDEGAVWSLSFLSVDELNAEIKAFTCAPT